MLNILVVDDLPIVRKITQKVLRHFSDSVVTTSSGREAVELCLCQQFDLIFMDLHMPRGMDGFQAAHAIRQINAFYKSASRCVIVALTAHYGLEEIAQHPYKVQINGYLDKPMLPTKMEQILVKFFPHQYDI